MSASRPLRPIVPRVFPSRGHAVIARAPVVAPVESVSAPTAAAAARIAAGGRGGLHAVRAVPSGSGRSRAIRPAPSVSLRAAALSRAHGSSRSAVVARPPHHGAVRSTALPFVHSEHLKGHLTQLADPEKRVELFKSLRAAADAKRQARREAAVAASKDGSVATESHVVSRPSHSERVAKLLADREARRTARSHVVAAPVSGTEALLASPDASTTA